MEQLQKQIEDLERDIQQDEIQYDIACKHPTYTEQFQNALRKHREGIYQKKQKLIRLKESI